MQDGQYQSVGTAPPPPDQAAAPAAPSGPSNWIYQGAPGITDAYAPANAVVASPGDVPKAPSSPPR